MPIVLYMLYICYIYVIYICQFFSGMLTANSVKNTDFCLFLCGICFDKIHFFWGWTLVVEKSKATFQ